MSGLNKTEALFMNEYETELMKYDKYKIIFVADHFNHHFWYEIKVGDEYLGDTVDTIFDAINTINNMIRTEEGL